MNLKSQIHMTLHAAPIKRPYASFLEELIKRENKLFINGPRHNQGKNTFLTGYVSIFHD